jgi:RNA polymerase sigma-70 factor (ECF subfamily)
MTAINASPALAAPGPGIERLYRDYGEAVRRWAGHLARSRSDADDIVQEVFLVAHVRRAILPALRNPGAWLYRIVENVARHLWRRRRRCRTVGAERLAELPDASPTPLDVLEERRLQARLDAALASLCDRDRRLLLLADRGRPAQPPLAIPGLKPQTVRVRRHRARLRIVRCLRELDAAAACARGPVVHRRFALTTPQLGRS